MDRYSVRTHIIPLLSFLFIFVYSLRLDKQRILTFSWNILQEPDKLEFCQSIETQVVVLYNMQGTVMVYLFIFIYLFFFISSYANLCSVRVSS